MQKISGERPEITDAGSTKHNTDYELNGTAKIIAKRREKASLRSGYIGLLLQIVFIALVIWFLFSQIFVITRVNGNEMFPSIKDGDLVIGYRLQKDYIKDDVVVYTVNGKTKVGRIAARWGDVVTLDDSGNLLVNGTAQSGEIMYPTYAKEGIEYPYTVPDDCVFILGDYRTQAEDSRDFGPIATKNVEGKVISLFRRRGI